MGHCAPALLQLSRRRGRQGDAEVAGGVCPVVQRELALREGWEAALWPGFDAAPVEVIRPQLADEPVERQQQLAAEPRCDPELVLIQPLAGRSCEREPARQAQEPAPVGGDGRGRLPGPLVVGSVVVLDLLVAELVGLGAFQRRMGMLSGAPASQRQGVRVQAARDEPEGVLLIALVRLVRRSQPPLALREGNHLRACALLERLVAGPVPNLRVPPVGRGVLDHPLAIVVMKPVC